ncbi:MAG: hypothetical protein ACHQAQ_09530 [Hyphomicrobiales bacterium]
MRPIVLILKLLCYAALGLLLAGIAALVYVAKTGGCPRFDEGAVECISPFYQSLGNFGEGVVLVTAFTGLPGFLAIAGLVFLVRDVLRWRRARQA